MSNYENCTVRVYSFTCYLVDENGDEILNEDGTTKLFKDYEGQLDTSTWAEMVDPELLTEYSGDEDDKSNN